MPSYVGSPDTAIESSQPITREGRTYIMIACIVHICRLWNCLELMPCASLLINRLLSAAFRRLTFDHQTTQHRTTPRQRFRRTISARATYAGTRCSSAATARFFRKILARWQLLARGGPRSSLRTGESSPEQRFDGRKLDLPVFRHPGQTRNCSGLTSLRDPRGSH